MTNSATVTSVPFVDLHAQYLTIKDEIDSAISDVIRNSAFVRSGHVDVFEDAFAKAIGTKHCISCANGTDALFVAYKALRLQEGDEVITAAHSWISTSETISLAGGKVVFCDTDDSFCIDPGKIESLVTPRTRGIVPVHLYGHACEMDRIMAIAKKHNLWVVEDCAQSHLSTFAGQTVGTFGNAATFSFYPGKNLGAMGDAGAIVTNDDQLTQWSELFARHGGKGSHAIEGINSRLDGLQAAILNAKLPRLQRWTDARRSVAKEYDRQLDGVGDLILPRRFDDREHVYHLYVIRTDRRDALRDHLRESGVSTVINYPIALPFLPAYERFGHQPEDFPNAFRNQSQILSLPVFPEMTGEQITRVTSAVKSFFDGV
ncbi:DegT/DnrJ/EryC1/StrS family aminotransferase [Rhodopirellula europaea]|uniref:Pleiotropic regulatory protein DegT n=1 Tax=Rhodopirellula europaea SH398 TaxID=1263868 RepID=M5RZX1_9BACT|nr:DegT/DnrJ/EryC1/StrS family aminotransferase [Rhodopirellula europaea]EMI24761.1 pleiotropic regulatory protein DegT [Rhodopirellula europaea SH398]